MTNSLASITFSMFVLLATTIVSAQEQADQAPKIKLKTNPEKVCAGEEFELICRVSAENAQILKVFVDVSDASGPEKTWKYDGEGVFEAKFKHVEKTPGMKEYEIWTKIKKGGESRFLGQSFKINVTPKDGDQDLEAFLSWMKKVGYSDEIINVYKNDGLNPVIREKWNKYFNLRKKDLAYRELQTMPIVFVDVLATEEEAINEALGKQTDKLEKYLTRIFGKTFKIEYLEKRVPYETNFGKPMLQKNTKGAEWLKFSPFKFNTFAKETAKRIMKERQLPSNAVIIHWAAKKWKYKGKELKIEDHTGSGPAFSGMGFGPYGIATYGHEWGHGLGLGHMFVSGPGSYASRAWGLDCIMNHTYVPWTNKKVGRLLSPLPRYALEPKDGYVDQKTFAATYSKAMEGTELLKKCLNDTQAATTTVTTMTWSTPWNSISDDSVVCQGLQNGKYEIMQLELQPEIEPGVYSLSYNEDMRPGPRKTLVLKKEGKKVASTWVAWMTKVSHTKPYRISFKDYLYFTIGPSKKGGGNLAGIGKLLNGKTFVVPEKK